MFDKKEYYKKYYMEHGEEIRARQKEYENSSVVKNRKRKLREEYKDFIFPNYIVGDTK